MLLTSINLQRRLVHKQQHPQFFSIYKYILLVYLYSQYSTLSSAILYNSLIFIRNNTNPLYFNSCNIPTISSHETLSIMTYILRSFQTFKLRNSVI